MASLIAIDTSEFAAALPNGGKLAGLDVGTKTIGLAICDAGWHFAGPAETIRRTKFTQDMEQLRAFTEREHVTGLVVGLPLNMDGTDSPRTQSVRAFARNLAPLDLPILLWDERWSTQAVEPNPRIPLPMPCWKTSTSTAEAAATASRFSTIAWIATTIELTATSISTNASTSTNATTSGSLDFS